MISIERDVGRGERFREPVDMNETNGIRLFNKQHRATVQTENSPQHWISKWRQWIGGEECWQ